MTSHVVPGFNSFRCLYCGVEEGINGHVSIDAFSSRANAFDAKHANCEPSEAGRARLEYSDTEGWLASWDTGVSSLTIHHVLSGRSWQAGPRRPPTYVKHPLDPADFGRCYRLLKVAPPEWRGRLGEVAARYKSWKPLVDHWDELEALYEEEQASGQCPKLYERMNALLYPKGN